MTAPMNNYPEGWQPPSAPAPTKRRRRWPWITVIVAVLVIGGGIGGGIAATKSADASPSNSVCPWNKNIYTVNPDCVPPTAPELPATSEPPTTTQDPTNDRGNITDAVDDGFTLTDTSTGATFATASIDKFTLISDCPAPYADSNSENGHLLRVDVRVSVDSNADVSDTGDMLNPDEFTELLADGTTASSLDTMPTYGCLPDSDNLPDTYNPGSKYRGSFVLDVHEPHGTLIYRPMGFTNGVEWKY